MLGINRYTLRSWRDKRRKGEPLLLETRNKPSRWSKDWQDEEYDYKRLMSKKGCSPDNSMCEGFFGTIKNKFFYAKDWKNTTCDDFIVELEKYLNWFKNKRTKKRLGYLSPKHFMLNYIQY